MVSTPEPPPENPIAEPKPATDWESVIGGNWANKAGVAVLVIGLALFLQYSLTHLGPSGRVGLGYLLGMVLLGAGLTLEKRDNWLIYARGLIGGGWAAIYFTSYAAHAIPAACVIDNPVFASLLLLAVALGMVLPSLRYRSQTVTGLAYFVTFGTLAPTPLSAFAVIAVIPLAASLIYIARRFGWFPMMAVGQIAVYVLISSISAKSDLTPIGHHRHFPLAGESVRPATVWVRCFAVGTLYFESSFVRATRISPGVEPSRTSRSVVTKVRLRSLRDWSPLVALGFVQCDFVFRQPNPAPAFSDVLVRRNGFVLLGH